MDILKEYTPQIDRFSIDECFMNFSNMKCFDKSPIEIAEEIRERVYGELGFTVNIGVSNNKLLAKVASDFQTQSSPYPLPMGN